MTPFGHRSAALLVATAFAAVALLSACSDTDRKDVTPATPTDSTISLAMPSTTAQVPDADSLSPASAKQLCDMMNADIDRWRSEGSVVAQVSFNGTVHNWAARNGGLNDKVIRDRGIVDDAAEQACPDVRKRALDALGTDDLASALAGFGG